MIALALVLVMVSCLALLRAAILGAATFHAQAAQRDVETCEACMVLETHAQTRSRS